MNQDDLGDIQVDHTGRIVSDIPDIDILSLVTNDPTGIENFLKIFI